MKIGFIGCGNMAAAMLNGILKAGILKPEELTASAVSSATRDKIRQELKIRLAASNQDVAAFSDIIFLAVKPQYYAQVIAEIREQVRGGQIYVSIAPGKSLEWLESQFGRPVGLVRAMPNTPAMAGEGMTAYCVNAQVTAEEKRRIAQICGYFGRAEEISESLMDVVTAVSGSSPAYVFVMVEAMADAAVSFGMARQQAFTFAAQAVLGSARMVLESGLHPAQLKDMVCSPGGTTIEAVKMLEKTGFRGSLMDAMKVCWEKSKGM